MRNADPGEGTVFDITHALEKHGLPDHDRPEHVDPQIFQAAQREADESFALGRHWVAHVTKDLLQHFSP